MTLHDFANIFAALAVQLRQTDADEATIRVYFEALKDLEVEFLAMAATRLARESDWFPKTSEWRAMAAKVEAERVEVQRADLRKRRAPLCVACSDTGWMPDLHGRVRKCECRKLRRLELLGRRPWPTPEIGPAPDTSDGPLTPAASMAVMTTLRPKPQIRVIRESHRSRLARLEDLARASAQAEPDAPQLAQPNDAAARNTFEGSDHMERTQR
jgi:hypothetical protein